MNIDPVKFRNDLREYVANRAPAYVALQMQYDWMLEDEEQKRARAKRAADDAENLPMVTCP